jgi:Xaa-Pro aminopeptidase
MNVPVTTADALLTEIESRLPQERADRRILETAASRREVMHAWLRQQDLDGVLISRRDNFAWLTGGAYSNVLNDTEIGTGHLLLTPHDAYLLAYSMDAERLMTEQLIGQPYLPMMQEWHKGDPREQAFRLVGPRLAVDAPLEGAALCSTDILRLHGPLAPYELGRTRWLARRTALNLEALALWVRPGMREEEIGRQMAAVFGAQGIRLEVSIVGSDERLGRIWHATPSEKPVRQYLSMHAAAQRWGLHANVNRFVSFGPPPLPVQRAHRAAVCVQAQVLSTLKPGLPYTNILELQKNAYAELGYPGEWKKHFQGGPTGYFLGDERSRTDLCVELNSAFDWFQTVQGIQVEELSLLTADGLEVASIGAEWPTMMFNDIRLPDMWVF